MQRDQLTMTGGSADRTPLLRCKRGFGAAAIAIVTMFSFPAAAAEVAQLNIGNWNGGVYTSNETGEFSHCAVSADYHSGITLLFSVTRDLQWSMGFSKPSWNLTPGKEYPVKYRVDRDRALEGTAFARSAKLAQVPLPPEDTLFNRFRRGNVLRVETAQDALEFSLTGTSKMLSTLLECAQRNAREERDETNPFAED